MIDYELNESFSIKDDKLAEWALKKIAEGNQEKERLISIARAEIEELEAKIEELNTQYDKKNEFLKYHLLNYFNTVPHKSTKTQESYKLLSGSLVMKKPTTKIKRPDDDLLLNILSLVDHEGKYVEVIKKPKWAEFKKTLTISGDQVIDENGEILCNIETEDVPASFDIKI